jgi:hypothetical protein
MVWLYTHTGNGKITLADMKKMKLELGIDMADGSLERFVAKADTNRAFAFVAFL